VATILDTAAAEVVYHANGLCSATVAQDARHDVWRMVSNY
jgi:hypothetical protein